MGAALAIIAAALLALAGASRHTVASISQTDKTWTCNGPVELDSVTVTITAASTQGVGVLLRPGCTGTIGRLDVTDSLDDGVKGAATDLTVSGGTIRCVGRAPLAHQDGVQVTGGDRIRFDGVVIDCPTANDAGFFVNPNAGQDPATWPTDVVFEHGYLAATLSSTAFVTDSQTGSGIVGSTLCPSPLGPSFTYRHGASAIDSGNSYPDAC